MRSRHGRLMMLWSLICALSVGMAGSARAGIIFEFEYVDRKSEPPDWDPDGEHLMDMLEAAGDRWKAILPLPSDEELRIKVDCYWSWSDDPDRPRDLAVTQQKNLASNKYWVRFFTRNHEGPIGWFVDPTPGDGSEFDFVPYTVSDPYDTDAGIGIDGVPDDFLEAGFRGRSREPAVPSAAGDMTSETGHDMYSVAIHELGHTLGLGYRSKRDALDDGDYEISTTFAGAEAGIGLRVALDEDTGKWDVSHLEAPFSLMYPSSGAGMRVLPCALDALVIASINRWTDPGSINYPRRYFTRLTGTYSWDEDPDFWFGGPPGVSEVAVVDGMAMVSLGTSPEVRGVYLGGGTDLRIGAQSLYSGRVFSMRHDALAQVTTGLLYARFFSHHGSTLEIVGPGTIRSIDGMKAFPGSTTRFFGEPDHRAAFIAPYGKLDLEDADLWVQNAMVRVRELDSYDGSAIQGGGSAFKDLEFLYNNGVIEAQNGSLVFWPAHPEVAFDLDGKESRGYHGGVRATGGSIYFWAPLADPFEGVMAVHSGQLIHLDGYNSVHSPGRIELLGDGATLSGAHLTIVGEGAGVQVYNYYSGDPMSAWLELDQDWGANAKAFVDYTCALYLMGESRYYAGTASVGAGTIVQVGDMEVFATDGGTVLGVACYDWDGDTFGGPPSNATLNEDAHLHITGLVGGHAGQITVKSGAELQVDEEGWALEATGEIILQGGTIRGGTIINYGRISGTGRIEAHVVSFGTIDCDVPGSIEFAGGVDLLGGECDCF